MEIGFILDIIIAVLLVLTITYAVRLNQRLGQLRNDKNELMELAKTFADATVKAESSIKSLKISSEALQNDVQKAEALRDDLAYLVDRGGRSADEMVASVRTPKAQHDDFSPTEDDGLLIEEAIRAATSGDTTGGRKRPGRRGPQDDRMQDRGETTRRVSPHPEPKTPQRAPLTRALQARDSQSRELQARDSQARDSQARKLGGGLGGLSGEDRLLDKHASQQEPDSIGDTDAARELLKALSSMK